MNSISYRKWDIYINNTVVSEKPICCGYYECVITPTLMALQSIEFLYENYQINVVGPPTHVQRTPQTLHPPVGYSRQFIITENNELCVRIYGALECTTIDENLIVNLLKQLDALSICIDMALNCNKISFIDNNRGTVFYGTRRPLGRGAAFEVEERMIAKHKIEEDYTCLLNEENLQLLLATKHYLTGMNLLGLEDQFPGLIEASFMQFYLGCEMLCQTHKCEEAKKVIAKLDLEDERNLQIIAHQVWQVRNEYFGHGITTQRSASNNYLQASAISKQVLVVRYLCRRLIDSLLPSTKALVREIGIYPNGYSESFCGGVESLSNQFYVPFSGRMCKIYKANCTTPIETYCIGSTT